MYSPTINAWLVPTPLVSITCNEINARSAYNQRATKLPLYSLYYSFGLSPIMRVNSNSHYPSPCNRPCAARAVLSPYLIITKNTPSVKHSAHCIDYGLWFILGQEFYAHRCLYHERDMARYYWPVQQVLVVPGVLYPPSAPAALYLPWVLSRLVRLVHQSVQ